MLHDADWDHGFLLQTLYMFFYSFMYARAHITKQIPVKKFMLVNKNLQICLLIGWWKATSQSEAVLENSC